MSSYRIETLTKENYDTWCLQAQAVLVKNELWEFVSGTKNSENTARDEFEKRDQLAKAELLLLISPPELKQVKTCVSAKDIWEKLKLTYQSSGPARKATLLKQLVLKKLNANEDVRDHLNNFFDIVDKLADMDVKIHPELLSIMMLYSLPTNFENFRIAIESRDELPSPEDLKIKITEENEARKNNIVTEGAQEAFYSKKKAKFCKICKKKGHTAESCWSKNKPEKKKEQGKKSDSYNVMSPCLKVSPSNMWCLDSGCTSHMCAQEDSFETIEPETGSLRLASNSHTINVEGKGKVSLEINDRTVNLLNTLYVPALSTNLLSVAKITENGNRVVFEKNKAYIKNNKGQTTLTAEKVNGLFYVKDCEKANVAHIAETVQELQKWHQKLGHLNENDLKLAATRNLIKGLKLKSTEKLPDCEVCIKGKMSRLPFQSVEGPQSTQPLEIIHTDVCGPIQPETLAGARYFVTFIDDYTKYCVIYFIKNKSEVFEKFKEYKNKVEKFHDKYKIKNLQSDNGTEYRNREFDSYLKDNGITRRLTAPYTPQQNGQSERKNRSLLDRARCLMIEGKLPQKLWAEAVYTANYLINRSPAKALKGCTPYEKWTGRTPSGNHLRVFGCKAFVLNKHRKRKFTPKATEGVFVGYAQNAKGYRIYFPEKDVVIISRDVKVIDRLYYHNDSTENDGDYNDLFGKQEHSQPERKEKRNKKGYKPNVDMDIVQTPVEKASDNNSLENPECSTSPEEVIDASSQNSGSVHQPEMTNENTRPQRQRKCPNWQKDYVLNQEGSSSSDEYQEVSNLSDRDIDEIVYLSDMGIQNLKGKEWREAIKSEIKAHIKNGTWEIKKKDGSDKNIVDFKLILKEKVNNIKKARLVARGFTQRPGIDYSDTWAPVAKLSSIRLLLATAVQENLKLHQLDVTTAYLNGDLDEKIVMKKPEFLEEYITEILIDESSNADLTVYHKAKKMLEDITKIKGEKVCLLKKALYGLKQSGRQWYKKLDSELKRLGFVSSTADPCVYILEKGGAKVLLGLYVDDMLMAYSNKRVFEDINEKLKKIFEIKDIGPVKDFIGMEIKVEHDKIELKQEKYIDKLLTSFGMIDCKPSATPIEPRLKLEKGNGEENLPYQNLIGSLMFLAVATRPDIMFAVSYLSQFNTCFGKEHFKSAKRVLRYLKGTKSIGISYEKTAVNELVGYADADWASCAIDRRSYTGYCFMMANGVISWESRKQRATAMSTAEAEYMALSDAVKEALHLKILLRDMTALKQETILIYNDNQAALKLCKNSIVSSKTKHIDIRIHFLKEHILNGTISVDYMETSKMLADLLTKGVPGPRQQELRKSLGLR